MVSRFKFRCVESLESRKLLSGTITGLVYQDIGGVGHYAAGDPPLAGWTVYLDLNHNGALDAGEPSAVSDASGRYTLSDVAAGPYDVRELPVTGFNPLPGMLQQVNLSDGQTLDNLDFGNQTMIQTTITGVSAAQDAVNNSLATGTVNAPNSAAAVSGKFAVTVNNNTLNYYRRVENVQISTQSLSQFFAGQPNAAEATNAKIFFDPAAGKFFLVAVANTASSSYLLIGASQHPDPTDEKWRIKNINVQATDATGAGAGLFASNVTISFNDQAVYISANLSDASGNFVEPGMWITKRDNAYTKDTKFNPKFFDPTNAPTLPNMPNIYAASFNGKLINEVSSMYFVTSAASGGNLFDVLQLRNPLAKVPTFSTQVIGVPTPTVGADVPAAPPAFSLTTPPPAVQPGGAAAVDTSAAPLSAVWRKNFLWVANTYVPTTGPDAGVATAYWFQININMKPDTIVDYGDISGSAISAGASTFAPAIAVDRDQNMVVSFAATGPSLDLSSYVEGRRIPDPLYTIRPPYVPGVGQAAYTATTGTSGLVDWGYSSVILDPANQSRFWLFSHYATDPSTPSGPWGQVLLGFMLPPKKFPVING